MSLSLLPNEIFRQIVEALLPSIGILKATRLRLVDRK